MGWQRSGREGQKSEQGLGRGRLTPDRLGRIDDARKGEVGKRGSVGNGNGHYVTSEEDGERRRRAKETGTSRDVATATEGGRRAANDR
jgi:hypothetical protein